MRVDTSLLGLLGLAPTALGAMQYLGVAMAGIDFGCDIDGTCPLNTIAVPLPDYDGGDGPGQMKHFVEDDKMNVFRIPASWQFLTADNPGGDLDKTNFNTYDKIMQACLSTGAYCMIDVHNFARYNGSIIGQGGPTDEVFVDLWTQLSSKYAKDEKVIFGIMNEPHDLDIDIWANTCQKVVTAVRKNGAESQMILLPGSNFTNAGTFVSTGSAEALSAIKNPDGSVDNLIMDLHKYLDINNSGTHSECTTNNVEDFQTISTWLRENKRLGMVSESGASSDSSCMTDFCQQNHFINNNSDVLIGFVGWAAGSFSPTYTLSLTPTEKNGKWTDNQLFTQCIMGEFDMNANATVSPPTSTSSSSSASSTSAGSTKTSGSADPSDTSSAKASETSDSGAAGSYPVSGLQYGLAMAVVVQIWQHLA